MGNAVRVVMPEMRHSLCTFHIMQNSIKHLCNLMKDDSCFLSDFKALMFDFNDVTKFEKEWEALLKRYKVHGNSWLERTYALKKKWARCYMKTTVTLGVRSTQLSESMNAKLKKSLKSKFDISTFFKLFSMVVSEKRYKEVEAGYNTKENMPREKSLLALVGNKQDKDRLEEYLIVSCDEEGEYVVTHDKENATLSCSCRKFETVGILCGHALKVLDVLVIKYIPETFSRGGQEDEGLDIHRSEGLNISDRYRELWPDAVRLAHKASEFKDGYILYKTRMKELDKEIEELRKKHYEFMGHGCELNGSDGVDKNAIENLIGNVKGIKKRGGPPKRGGKRHKSWVEKQPRKRKQMMTNSLGCPNNDKENQDPLLHHECVEIPQASRGSHFNHGNVEKDIYRSSFSEMLNAGLDDNFLSSLSQGSNRIQSNDERVFGDFNVLSSQVSTSLGSYIFK
ncbi:hypothetical protein RJ640_023550 [Escallonia rubra]|uniref:Protein FAR1-RELATED SEQUENCE n=1 Tax=Escallonia rubra TaxID=112253 RepID=A0AA88QYR2_9ASTE|nr:hypothetical protein RJ640_023550 [Escallonia rubra]